MDYALDQREKYWLWKIWVVWLVILVAMIFAFFNLMVVELVHKEDKIFAFITVNSILVVIFAPVGCFLCGKRHPSNIIENVV